MLAAIFDPLDNIGEKMPFDFRRNFNPRRGVPGRMLHPATANVLSRDAQIASKFTVVQKIIRRQNLVVLQFFSFSSPSLVMQGLALQCVNNCINLFGRQYAGRSLVLLACPPGTAVLCLTVCLHFRSRADYRTGLGMLFLLILLFFLLF